MLETAREVFEFSPFIATINNFLLKKVDIVTGMHGFISLKGLYIFT